MDIKNSERGNTLIIVFLLIAILLTLGMVLSNISILEYSKAEDDSRHVQAYYLARSGANIIAKEIISNNINPNDLVDKRSDQVNLDNGFFEIEVEKDSGNFEIISTANVEGKTETITLILKSSSLFENAVFSENGLKLENCIIDGSVGTKLKKDDTNVTIDSVNWIDGSEEDNLHFDIDKELPSYDVPTDLEYKGEYELEEDSETIDENGEYSKIKIEGSGTVLEFEINSDNDLQIVVDELKIEDGAKIVISNPLDYNGRVLLYVKQLKAETDGTANVIDNQTEDPNKLMIFDNLDSKSTTDNIKIETAGSFYGGIYAKNSTVKMETGAYIKGAIIADKFISEDTNTTLEYSPIKSEGLFEDFSGGYSRDKWSD